MEPGQYSSERLNPLKIYVVVNIIKDYIICPKTILSCKCVDKNWNKIFKLKASQALTIKNFASVFLPFPTGMGYDSATHDFHDKEFKITRLFVNEKMLSTLSRQNVVDFFENKGRFLKYFAWKIDKVSTQSHSQFIDNVLLKWCPELEELKLIGHCHQQIPFKNDDEKKVSLKKLILDFSEDDDAFPFSLTPLPNNILQVARNLESFVYAGNFLYEDLHNVSVKLMILMSIHSKQLSSLEFHNVTIGKEVFKVMTTANWPLRTFILKGSHKEDLKIRHLNSFILAYKDTMKHLHLHLNWIPNFDYDELNIHDLTKLQVLEINVHGINVGGSGLLGNLKFLSRMTLFGTTGGWSWQNNLNGLFRNGTCPTLKFLSLNENFIKQVPIIANLFPNLQHLQISIASSQFMELDRCFSLLFQKTTSLDKLEIKVYFTESDAWNERLIENMVVGFCQYKVRILRMAAFQQSLNILPRLSGLRVQEGLFLNHQHTFYCIEFEGFKIHANEIALMAKVVTERSNFLKLIDCNIVSVSEGECYFLKHEQIFSYNVDAKIQEIISNVRSNQIRF